jgi:hypothetical protein
MHGGGALWAQRENKILCSGQQQGENKHPNAKTQRRKGTKQFSAPLSLCVCALSLYYLVANYRKRDSCCLGVLCVSSVCSVLLLLFGF